MRLGLGLKYRVKELIFVRFEAPWSLLVNGQVPDKFAASIGQEKLHNFATCDADVVIHIILYETERSLALLLQHHISYFHWVPFNATSHAKVTMLIA